MKSKYIIILLIILIIVILYMTFNTKQKKESFDQYIVDINSNKTNKKKVQFSPNLDIRNPTNLEKFGTQIDTIKFDDKKINNNLLDEKVIIYNNDKNNINLYEPLNQTDQNKMFDEIENEIKQQYDSIYSTNGYYQNITRPNISTSIINGNKTNSDLNPILNTNMFNLTTNDMNNKSIWEIYDEKTTDNFKQYNNLNNLNDNCNDKSLYKIENSDGYGGTKFDTYGNN